MSRRRVAAVGMAVGLGQLAVLASIEDGSSVARRWSVGLCIQAATVALFMWLVAPQLSKRHLRPSTRQPLSPLGRGVAAAVAVLIGTAVAEGAVPGWPAVFLTSIAVGLIVGMCLWTPTLDRPDPDA